MNNPGRGPSNRFPLSFQRFSPTSFRGFGASTALQQHTRSNFVKVFGLADQEDVMQRDATRAVAATSRCPCKFASLGKMLPRKRSEKRLRRQAECFRLKDAEGRAESHCCNATAVDVNDQHISKTKLYEGKTAVVVGGGPSGSVVAAYLARHGFTVKMFEKRGDLRQHSESYERSFWMSLDPQTADVLRDVGVVMPTADGTAQSVLSVYKGTGLINPDGSVTNMTLSDSAISCSRHDITTALLDAIHANYSDSVTVYFNHALQDVAFDEQRITFRDDGGTDVVANYDLLVAADGANSAVRQHLIEFDNRFSLETVSTDRCYMSFAMQLPEDASSTYHKLCEVGRYGGLAFSTPRCKPNERSGGFLFRLTKDGAVHGLMFGHVNKIFGFIKENTKEWEDTILPDDFPQDWKDRVRETMNRTEPTRLPSVIHTSRFYGRKTLLVGDAGHSICPTLGLGCNLAVQDGKYLNEALRSAEGNIDRALLKFNDLRYSEVQCFQMLEEATVMNELKITGWRAVWRFMCSNYTQLCKKANELFKQEWIPPTMAALRGTISARTAVRTVIRDCLLLMLFATAVMLLAVKLAVLPSVRFLITRMAV